MSRRGSEPFEPITIAEWWKNRSGESVRLVLNEYPGRAAFDPSTCEPGYRINPPIAACSIRRICRSARISRNPHNHAVFGARKCRLRAERCTNRALEDGENPGTLSVHARAAVYAAQRGATL
jgi:hypothetical protein